MSSEELRESAQTVVRRFKIRLWIARAIWTFVTLFDVVATFVLLSAFNARKLPDLDVWHRDAPEGELRARDLLGPVADEATMAVSRAPGESAP